MFKLRSKGFLQASLTLLVLSLFGACKTQQNLNSDIQQATAQKATHEETNKTDLNLCVAVRGNGNLMFGHIPAMARINEHYGPIDAMAGGSSASLTTFFYESMRLNPVLKQCNKRECSQAEVGARLALMLKSLQGYIEFLGETDEVLAIKSLLTVSKRMQTNGFSTDEVIATFQDPAKQKALLEILESEDLKNLINPQLIANIRNAKSPESKAYHTHEAYESMLAPVKWSVEDQRIFFRPGLINFDKFAHMMGRIADFYAGRGSFYDQDDARKFLNSCAEPAREKAWPEISELPAVDTTCGKLFADMLGVYRTQLIGAETAKDDSVKHRVDDFVGSNLHALIATSVVEGAEANAALAVAKLRYMSGQAPNLHLNFAQIGFGYWGHPDDMKKIKTAQATPELDIDNAPIAPAKDKKLRLSRIDRKTEKFLDLGQLPWLEILKLSPAEPSLAPITPIPGAKNRSSAGGWPDLAPTLVLQDLGCKHIVYITRQGDESNFPIGIARHLGMQDDEAKELYDLNSSTSSFSRSLAAASVWCSDWDHQGTFDLNAMFKNVYYAPFDIRQSSKVFFTAGATPYPNERLQDMPAAGIRGCRAGAPPLN